MKAVLKILLILILLVGYNAAGKNKNGKVALLYSQYTEKLLSSNSTFVQDQITFWELFFIQNKIDYAVITDDELESNLSDEFSLLILPSSVALSDNEISSVELFLKDGNSILANKLVGEKDESGKVRSNEILNSIFGLSLQNKIAKSEMSKIHTIKGSAPLSKNIPAGFRLRVTTSEQPMRAKINSINTKALGNWYNDDFPYAGLPEDSLTTAIAYGKKWNGKFVWIGFDFNEVVGTKVHQHVLNDLLINCISWLQNKNTAWIENWQFGKQSAVIISCDVEYEFENIINAIKILNEEKVEGQYYILTDVMDNEILNQILENGDIGLHGDNHDVFRWQSYDQQYDRLLSARIKLESKSGRKIFAFRPPETVYDKNTIEALKKLNYTLLASDNIEDRSVPQFYDEENNLLIIPETGYDDYDLLIRFKIDDYKKQAEKYLLDYSRVNDEGGLYVLYYHSQLQCLKDNVEALRICIDKFKENNSWITTANKISEWQRIKNNLSVSIINEKEESLQIEIKNLNKVKAENFAVGAFIGEIYAQNAFEIFNEKNKMKFDFDKEKNQLKIYITELSPSETRTITVKFKNIQ